MPKVNRTADGIHLPTIATLRQYGLSPAEWSAIFRAQGWVCAICRRDNSKKWVTDHEHVAGWKKMRPTERRRYVRGIICSFCNSHVVGRFVTLAKAERVVEYLRAYLVRKDLYR